VDFHVAQRIFGEIAAGDSKLFATAQTSHDTDMVIRELVTRDPRSADALRRWMTRSPSSAAYGWRGWLRTHAGLGYS
jgi:hypothetical protein